MRLLLIPLMFLAMVQVEYTYTGRPVANMAWAVELGNQRNITYDPVRHEWINDNQKYWEMCRWTIGDRDHDKWCEPIKIPEDKKPSGISLRKDLYKEPEILYAGAIFASTKGAQKRRFVLINPENQVWEPQYRTWAHLGMLYVGTAARREGWDVVMWDEHNQGKCDLGSLVEPGDIVGFSMVCTGITRGAEMARQTKELGARYVVCGNDAAIFRAKQLLSLPGKPVDAVFTSNSVMAVRAFFRQIAEKSIGEIDLADVATSPANAAVRSNQGNQLLRELVLRSEQKRNGTFDASDVFMVPDFDLYPKHVWDEMIRRYAENYGHKHSMLAREEIRNATVLFAQGCTRTGGKEVCNHCGISSVADIRIPDPHFWEQTVQAYADAGFNTLYNTTDSAYEMGQVANGLREVGAHFDTFIIYGRAWGMAHHPEHFEKWASLVDDRLLINCGMESADDRILHGPMAKAMQPGSRLAENRRAVLNMKSFGEPIHLHYSLIFGSPGETVETCEKNLEFVQWTSDVLGSQLDLMEGDIFWVNPGAPSAKVMEDYEHARNMALTTTGKSMTREEWHQNFGVHSNALMYPISVEDAWYYYFTDITRDQAQEYNRIAGKMMARHEGAIPRRASAFRAEVDRT